MSVRWRVSLFDGPQLQDSTGGEHRRLRSQRVGALLSYLCLQLGQDCPREEVAEALWPEDDPQVTANRLRVALTALRHLLEPPGVVPGSVVDTERSGFVRLRPERVWCDVPAFEQARRRGDYQEAARLATGPLLPGFWDDWILTERQRLEAVRAELPEPLPPSEPTLPLYLTRFFGREAERERLSTLLQQERLVTLMALGGMGKTRLAVETARSLPLPVVFIPLAELTDGEQLAETVLRALGGTAPAGTEPQESLLALLARRGALLLILDNAEHLQEAVAAGVVSLLERAPLLRVLVTSRRALEVFGEVVVPLEPLTPPVATASLAQLLAVPAVALFVDRAQQVHPGFALTERHAQAVVALCQKLEGMPLALELAAARTRTQTPTQLAAAL